MAKEVSPDSFGIAKFIVERFLPDFSEDPSRISDWYGEGATLCYCGQQAKGRAAISGLLSQLPKTSIRVDGWEVQTVPDSNLWSMIIVIGMMKDVDTGKMGNFHSSFYVESRSDDHKAFIRYHALNRF